MKKSAIILAGGKGSRLGYVDKAFLTYKGIYFIDILLDKLKDFDEIIVVTNSPEKYLNYKDIKIVEDVIKDIGPLGGIFSGLQNISHTEALVISCDTPFISSSFIGYLKSLNFDEDIIIPTLSGKKEPLCGLYKRIILKNIENLILEKEYKIANLFSKVITKYIEVESFSSKISPETESAHLDMGEIIKSFYNVNTQEDLEETWNFSV